ncbi:MAG: Co2+/Mg2+ efflux protein ApaG, partial [Longimicrobiales bacterium]
TDGIRITVQPRYAADHSDAAEPRHVFVYHIRIENVSDRTAQLLWRHWDIHDDALLDDTEVEGEGVVGEQPVLEPGDVHEYESFCVLRGTRGWMQGWYEFVRLDGSKFRAEVPRFDLDARAGAAGESGPHPMA